MIKCVCSRRLCESMINLFGVGPGCDKFYIVMFWYYDGVYCCKVGVYVSVVVIYPLL